MNPDDLDQALGLSMTEGWNQTMKDWKLLLDNPDNVCIVAEKDNRVAGTATALNHKNRIAWIGMVLVDKSLRGQGAGKMLLEYIIDKLKHAESVKLDATPAGEPLYRKLGFVAEYNLFRMTCDRMAYEGKKISSTGLYKITMEDISQITDMDQAIFGADRSYLLSNLLNNYPEKAFLYRTTKKIEGYVFGRDGARFNYVGPVCALSVDSARLLISNAIEHLNNQTIAIDVPEDKEDLISWLGSIGFIKQRHFVRMFLTNNPHPGLIKSQYLISGPEFG